MKTPRWIAVSILIGVAALAGLGFREMAAARPLLQGGADALPPDVYPDSRNRLPLVKREDLSEARKKLYDAAAAATEPGHSLRGEAGIRLHSKTEDARFESPVGRRLTELAIIMGARNAEQNFEWTLHAEEGLRQGLEREIVDIVRFNKPVTGIGEKETAIITVGREMNQNHKVSSATFAQALKALGASDLVDIVVTMSRRSNETPLIFVDQHLPLDWKEVVPMPITIIKEPPDIFPDSRNRLPLVKGQRAPTPGRTLAPYGTGPAQIAMYEGGGHFLEANLGHRLIELAALVTARELDNQVVWTLHELEALKHGLHPAVIDAVRHRKPLTGLGTRETLIIQLGREMIGKHRVSPETFKNTVEFFGVRDSIDIATLFEHYATTCGILTVFDQHLPPGQKPLLPIP